VPPPVRTAEVALGPLDLMRRQAGLPPGLVDAIDLGDEPLIEEPVTSGGDNNIWTGAPKDGAAPDKPR
jgi:hypothetical protein